MRGTVAKRIRKIIYGDISLRKPRIYVAIAGGEVKEADKGIKKYYTFIKKMSKYATKPIKRYFSIFRGTAKNTGERARYQLAKKEYKRHQLILS